MAWPRRGRERERGKESSRKGWMERRDVKGRGKEETRGPERRAANRSCLGERERKETGQGNERKEWRVRTVR